MSNKYLKRFFKTDEDDIFIEVSAVPDGDYLLKPKSNSGYWYQKSTHKRFYRNVVVTLFADGSSNKDDYIWIEY